ncbi:MAG: hypothetical protein IJ192_07445 [Clostridia bacterium]|nr:hypothetical protein [Clostridia bacterium]
MSLNEPDKIDAAAVDGNELVLLVVDSLSWNMYQKEHLKMLQDKYNSYIRYIESKGYREQFPNSVFDSFRIDTVFKYQYDNGFVKMLEKVKDKLKEKKITITYRVAEGE